MSDKNERSVASTGSVGQLDLLLSLVEGVRGMGIGSPYEGERIMASDVVMWAVGEIEKLQSRLRLADAAIRCGSPTLTTEERDAISDAAMALERDGRPSVNRLADVLRGITGRAQVPLLTEGEREAVECTVSGHLRGEHISTLCRLLERTK